VCSSDLDNGDEYIDTGPSFFIFITNVPL